MTKAELRSAMLAHRRSQGAALAEQASANICQQLMPLVKEFNCVAGYLPMKGEVNLLPLLHWLVAHGKTVAVPRVISKTTMEFRRYTQSDATETDAMGLATCNGEVVTPECLLVPLLAFDDLGNRLGYGGGFYDRVIPDLRATFPHFKAYGVAFGFQRVDNLPIEAHDARLDGVIAA